MFTVVLSVYVTGRNDIGQINFQAKQLQLNS